MSAEHEDTERYPSAKFTFQVPCSRMLEIVTDDANALA